jgi:hypothetical protein
MYIILLMDNTNISLTAVIREVVFTTKSDIIENLGYIKDDDLSNDVIAVYIDKRIQTAIAILPGADLEAYIKDKNFIEIINIFKGIDYLKYKINKYEKCIEEVIQKYSEYTIIFFGHSLGGFMINLKLQDSKYNCYVYNPCFINKQSSENIRNYRTNGDILSLGLIGKETETVNLDFLDGFIKCQFNIFKFLLEIHETTIFTIYPDKSIIITIPCYKA